MAIFQQLELCVRLKELRERKGYSQIELARRLQLSQAAYSRLESGLIDISFSRLFKLGLIYEMSVSELLEGL
jgi:transcriptional regulator with XRE-family HTH domain